MNGKWILAPLLLVMVTATGFLAGYTVGQPDYVVAPYDGNVMRVELWVYKNGELVYYDPDDPPTTNFVYYLAGLFMVDPPDLTLVDGTTVDPDNTGYAQMANHGGNPRVVISNDTVTFSRTMYTLNNMVMSTVGDTQITVTDTSITIAGTITVTSPMNITYIGLVADTSETYNKLALIFADPLSQPIAVQAGDVVTVVYKIVVP